jgi:putative transposase
MTQNRKLSRAISDMGLGTFRHQLTYKAKRDGVTVIVADRWFPSSRLCRQCGGIHDALTLADRVFVCPACGFTDDRDFHAADNLEAYPRLVGNGYACGETSSDQSFGTGETGLNETGTMKRSHVSTF